MASRGPLPDLSASPDPLDLPVPLDLADSSVAQEVAKLGIELVDALRLLVQSDFDALQEPQEMVDLPAEIFVFQTGHVHAAAGKIVAAAVR